MKLKISIDIIPPQKEISASDMDTLLSGELVAFEKWFVHRQRAKGLEASGLIAAERGIVKAYLLYAATEPQAEVV